jgi:tRNA-dihydrouridine synthase A
MKGSVQDGQEGSDTYPTPLAPATPHRLCVAPMMQWTDRHCRALHRLFSPHARLYTEMVTTSALEHGPRERLLAFDPVEHPVALQLGGSDPVALARCARWGADAGYDEINLNAGCPSDRVQEARIGACLMKEPARVADCVAAMRAAVQVPVTVKCRLGVDDADGYDVLATFVAQIAQAGVATVLVHARKAILRGLSPAQNRTVPPLDYDRVYRLKADFPALAIVLNGGLGGGAEGDPLPALRAHADALDGIMIGRAAYHDPWLLAGAENALFGTPLPEAHILHARIHARIVRHLEDGGRLHDVTRHLLGLCAGAPGARRFRRHLSEHAHRRGAGIEVFEAALRHLEGGGRMGHPSERRCSRA